LNSKTEAIFQKNYRLSRKIISPIYLCYWGKYGSNWLLTSLGVELGAELEESNALLDEHSKRYALQQKKISQI
jgi:hypothetical protein